MSYLYLLQVILDWVVGCANHNKDLSDGECGDIQHLIDRANMAHESRETTLHSKVFCYYILCILSSKLFKNFVFVCEQIEDCKAVVELARKEMSKPKKSIFEKKGKGIYRRFFHYVGIKEIKRRLPTVTGFSGSKS